MRTTLAVALPLLLLLAATVWWGARLWVTFDADIPLIGYAAMGGGILLSLVVGCGLMALVFYSARRGYDDAAHRGGGERP